MEDNEQCDNQGRITKQTFLDGDVFCTEYGDKGFVVKQTFTDRNGDTDTCEFERDVKGNIVKTTYTHSDGTVDVW